MIRCPRAAYFADRGVIAPGYFADCDSILPRLLTVPHTIIRGSIRWGYTAVRERRRPWDGSHRREYRRHSSAIRRMRPPEV